MPAPRSLPETGHEAAPHLCVRYPPPARSDAFVGDPQVPRLAPVTEIFRDFPLSEAL